MSHSVVRDFPVEKDNTLVLVINKDGELNIDQETLEAYMKLGNTQVSIVRVDKEEGDTVDMTVETFDPSNTKMEELSIDVEDDFKRNLLSFQMDHCYTPLTSPSQQKPVASADNTELELDDLAQTLSLLEGSTTDTVKTEPKSPVINNKIIHKVYKGVNKTLVLNKQPVVKSDTIKSPPIKSSPPSAATVKSPPVLHKSPPLLKTKVLNRKQLHQQLDSDYDDDDDDDYNDEDFEVKNKRNYKRRVDEKKIRKPVKIKSPKPPVLEPKIVELKLEPKIEPSSSTSPTPSTPTTPESSKSPDSKKLIKKEKKVVKPPPVIDDGGLALFSTPDIIRRVGGNKTDGGGGKSEKTADSPESQIKRPAKIEARSDSNRSSTDNKIHKSPTKSERTSIDSKSEPRLSETKDLENLDLISQLPLLPETTSIDNQTFDSITQAVSNLENEIPVIASVPNLIASNPDFPASQILDPNLDIGQAILDNINTDELIPEDILYQVAKLVENPDVQNVIDRTLVEALDPTIQNQIVESPQITQQMPVVSSPQIPQTPQINQQQIPLETNPNITKNTTSHPIKILRSDGRVLTLPPIEKPATRSSKKKQEPPAAQTLGQKQLQPKQLHLPKPVQQQHHVQQPLQMPTAQLSTEQPVLHQVDEQQKIETAVRLTPKQLDGNPLQQLVGSDIDTDSDESWNSEDDPDRLWCICKQPHNNRFMICCDTCEDWFHGKCVNITKAMGQQMEQQQKEWMCPNCVKKLNSPTTSTQQPSPNPIARKINKLGFGESSHKRKSVDSTSTCIVCSAPSRANSVYCSDACILKHAQGVEKDTNKAQKNIPQRIIVFERSTGKCLSGPNAPSAANLKQWLKEHPGFEVVRPANKQQNLVQSKLSLVKNTPGKEGVALALNRKGVQVGVMPHSSKQQNAIKLIPAAKLNTPQTKPQQLAAAKTPTQPSPKPKLTQTTLKLSISPPKTVKTPQLKSDKVPPGRERKQKLHPQAETPSKQNAPESIRDNVKRTLYEQLMTRLKEAADLKLTEDEVDKMATEIEMQLCKLFNDVGPKYRAKYRSLIFNIKDTKNQTLWRRICEKDITPSQLVRLSPDEMASQELARWRERENKHQLDMIKKSELEMLSINRTYVLKTHKGEQVMEDRPTVKVDSSEIMPGLGADSTSEHDTSVLSDKADDHDRRSASKHSHRDKDKRTDRSISKDRHKSSKSSRSKRSRSRDRDRSSHRNDRKRSRSRDRHHRSHKSSRHKRDKYITEHLDKKSREILDNLENNKIVPPPEDRLWKHVPQQDIQVASPDSDSDHEPSSTVTIPTPPRCVDPEELSKTLGSPLDIPKVVEPKEVKPPRTDPRLVRETEIVPKTESPAPVVSLSPSTSPVPPAPPKFTSESKETIIWEGNINMVDVAKFFITLHEVSGDCSGLKTELPSTLEIVGRISPDTVWDYIGKMRKSNSKIISILRLTAGNVEEKMPYIALYSYLSSRNRLGVIKSTNNAVKDFYILPLASQSPLPQALLPLSGPGFEEQKPNLLLGIIVRAKRKRSSVDIISGGSISKRSRVEQTSSEIPSNVNNVSRSYTPPPTRDPRVRLPAIPAANDDDEPYSPEDSDPETTVVPTIRTNTTTIAAPIIKTTDITSVLNVALKLEPSKFDAIPGLDVDTGVNDLQRKMEELDKCIEKQKEEIQNISRDIVQSGAAANISTNLSSISLPSNLQQILDSIKNIPSTSAADGTEEYCPTTPGFKPTDDLTIPLLLPKLNARHAKSISTIPLQLPKAANRDPTPTTTETLILPNLSIPPPNLPSILPTMTSTAITLPTQIHPPGTTPLVSDKEPKPVSVLSSLSEEDLIRKAAEMLGEAENESGRAESPEIDEITPVSGFSAVYTPTPTNQPPAKRTKLDDSQPPVPGLEDEYQD